MRASRSRAARARGRYSPGIPAATVPGRPRSHSSSRNGARVAQVVRGTSVSVGDLAGCWSSSRPCSRAGRGRPCVENRLARMEAFCEVGAALNPANSHQAKKQVRREPVLTDLALEDRTDVAHLPAGRLPTDGHEHVRRSQIAVVLGDLEIGRASCRERVWVTLVAVAVKKKDPADARGG